MLAGAIFGAGLSEKAEAAAITWTSTSNGNWNVASNWFGSTVPTSIDTARLGQTTLAETIVTDTQAATGVQFSNNATNDKGALRIQNGGILNLGGSGMTSSDKTNGQAFAYIENGGRLNITQGNISWGRGAATTTQEFYVYAGGTVALTGNGTTTNGNIYVGGSQTGARAAAYFYQSGGSVSATNLNLDQLSTETGNNSSGLYQISGTSTLSIVTAINNGGLSQLYDNGTLRVVGSTSTIGVSGASGAYTQGAHSTLQFALDNGGVTKINLAGGNSTATLGGILAAGFQAGAALTTTTSFRLIEAENVTGSFVTTPNSTLWTGSIVSDVSGTRDAYVLSYQAGAKQGVNISISGTDATSFTAVNRGYSEITGLSLNQQITLNLDAVAGTGKTIADLIAYFNTNGLTATVGTGIYDISLAFTAGANGSSYFGWDLTTFNTNGDAMISGLQVVPEPATIWLMATALGLFVVVARRRRARAQA